MADGDLLRRAAERAGQRRFYLASSLLAYARAERLDDAGLAVRLGCDAASLSALLLCRRPTGEGSVFRADVEAIAERFRLDAARLVRVIRAADAVVALQGATPDHAGRLLAAARDRDDATPDGEAREQTALDHTPRPDARPDPAHDVTSRVLPDETIL
jgi:hypothetical protein